MAIFSDVSALSDSTRPLGAATDVAGISGSAAVAPVATDASTAADEDVLDLTDEGTDQAGLTSEEREQVQELAQRDREVRAHENAHARVGGEFASAPQYEFEVGPDGRAYAVEGSVAIDTSPIAGDPEATIDKMETVRKAALAPAEPSSTDRQVAAKADAAIRQAEAELRAQEQDEQAAATPGSAVAITV